MNNFFFFGPYHGDPGTGVEATGLLILATQSPSLGIFKTLSLDEKNFTTFSEEHKPTKNSYSKIQDVLLIYHTVL